MPSGKDVGGGGRRGGSTTKKNAFLFVLSQELPGCWAVSRGAQVMFTSAANASTSANPFWSRSSGDGEASNSLFDDIPTPREIVEVARQLRDWPSRDAKRVLAVAVHKHYKRLGDGLGRHGC